VAAAVTTTVGAMATTTHLSGHQLPPYGSSWGGGGWRSPWTGAMGPGLLDSHPPAQAYQAYQPSPMLPPHHQPSWNTTGLVQALQAASLQQSNNQGDWYMDSGASLSVPCRPGTPAYKLQAKIRRRACICTLPCALRLWTPSPCSGGL
jgi:hypothetical protein